MKYEVQIEIENNFGKFKSRKSALSQENYDQLINMSKKFYLSGFQLECEDDTFIIFPPEIVKNSILKIYATKIENV